MSGVLELIFRPSDRRHQFGVSLTFLDDTEYDQKALLRGMKTLCKEFNAMFHNKKVLEVVKHMAKENKTGSEELKTLKDILSIKSEKDAHGHILTHQFQSVAKEWVKKSDMQIWDEIKYLIEDGDYNDIYIIKHWIKHFFNLEEK